MLNEFFKPERWGECGICDDLTVNMNDVEPRVSVCEYELLCTWDSGGWKQASTAGRPEGRRWVLIYHQCLCKSCFFFFNFYWSRVHLQCFVSFCCTAKWISYTYTYTHSSLDYFPIEVITEYWVEFPVLYSRSSLVIYFLYSSVYFAYISLVFSHLQQLCIIFHSFIVSQAMVSK